MRALQCSVVAMRTCCWIDRCNDEKQQTEPAKCSVRARVWAVQSARVVVVIVVVVFPTWRRVHGQQIAFALRSFRPAAFGRGLAALSAFATASVRAPHVACRGIRSRQLQGNGSRGAHLQRPNAVPVRPSQAAARDESALAATNCWRVRVDQQAVMPCNYSYRCCSASGGKA